MSSCCKGLLRHHGARMNYCFISNYASEGVSGQALLRLLVSNLPPSSQRRRFSKVSKEPTGGDKVEDAPSAEATAAPPLPSSPSSSAAGTSKGKASAGNRKGRKGWQYQDSLGIFQYYASDGTEQKKLTKPERIIIMRHGESMGNLDETTYSKVPDWQIPLTEQGFKDARQAGKAIKKLVGDKPLFFYTSPYLRTKQTLAGLVEAFDNNYIIGVREEPRLTEQQFGNFQNLVTIRDSKQERSRFGRFYYRFPEGESGLDVYNRATSFIATMYRDFANEALARDDLNIVIVTHGLTLRLLVMRWFQYSINDFENTENPGNGDFVIMERKSDSKHTWFELTPESLALINFKPQKQFGSLWKLLSELPKEPPAL